MEGDKGVSENPIRVTEADTPNGEPDPPPPPGYTMSPLRRRTIMLALCLALFLSALDVTIVATALPTIARQVGATAAGYAWIGSAYTLASTSSVPLWVEFSNIFGRKPVIMLANATFLGGSLMAGLAGTVGLLIGGRVVQGLGSGGCMILVTVIIGDLFEVKDRAKYYGITGVVWAVSSSVGPVLGGVFTQTIGWRWCFLINLPFDGVSLLVLQFALNLESPKTPITAGLRALDWVGSLLIIGGTVSFLYGLELGSSGMLTWSHPRVLCLLIFGSLILVLFGLYEAYLAPKPLIPFRIFTRRTNIAAIILLSVHSFVFIAYDYFLPLYFQAALGMRPIVSGAMLLCLVLPLSAMTMSTGWFIRRTSDYRLPIYAGASIMTLGTGLFISLGQSVSYPKIVTFQILAGIGAGPLFQSPMIALQSHVEQGDVAASASASTFIRSLFSSTSIVIGTVLLQSSLGGGRLVPGGEKDQRHTGDSAPHGEYVAPLRLMWTFYCAMCGVLIAVSPFIKRMPQQKLEVSAQQAKTAPDNQREKP